jgi:hypothetical protein
MQLLRNKELIVIDYHAVQSSIHAESQKFHIKHVPRSHKGYFRDLGYSPEGPTLVKQN